MSLNGKRILVVDDEVMLQEILKLHLEMIGALVTTASSGQIALKICQDQNFDLIISDVRMPNGDGIELVRSLASTRLKLVPVLFVSGFADISPETAKQLNVKSILSKPIVFKNLITAINNVLK